MTQELEALFRRRFNNQAARDLGQGRRDAELKPLASWVADLLGASSFFQNWLDDGKPVVFWLPASSSRRPS